LYAISKGSFSELKDKIVTVRNQQATDNVIRNWTDGSDTAHTAGEERRQEPAAG